MKLFRALKSNYISQKFGQNFSPLYIQEGMKGHNGVDWVASDGEEVRWNADCRGLVVHVCDKPSYGLGVTVLTNDGFPFKHIFWHLKDYCVKVGDVLDTGDLLGHADNTGQSTGIHLHYGLYPCVMENGEYINSPQLYENGYKGAIDPMPLTKNIYVLEYLTTQGKVISILQNLIAIYKQLIGKK